MKARPQDEQHAAGQSYYQQQLNADQRQYCPPLNQDLQVDVAIIGAGFAGLSTAFALAGHGCRDVAVFEAGELGAGASGRNGGFIMGGYSLSPAALLRQLGDARARELYQLTVSAQQLIKSRIREHALDCDLVDQGIVLADRFGRPQRLRAAQQIMNQRLGADWQWLAADALRDWVRCDHYGNGLLEPQGAHFQPLAYVHGLAGLVQDQGIKVYSQTPCLSVRRDARHWQLNMHNAGQERVQVRCKKLVICCGGYIKGLNVEQAAGIMPIATYMVATEPLDDLLEQLLPGAAAVYDNSFAFDYYRKSPDRRLLWGGRISVQQRSVDWIATRLKADMVRLYPQLAPVKIDFAWSGLMAYTRSSMPVIRQHQAGHWSALGFGGHGVSTTTLAGGLLAAGLCGVNEDYRLFDHYRAQRTYGTLGLCAAQLLYWYQQIRDLTLRK